MDDAVADSDSRVDAYFGDLIGEVALDTPVSRVMLRRALARLQATAGDLDSLPSATSVYLGETEEVFTLTTGDWTALAESAGVSTAERHAAREVHRRLAVSLVGTPVVGHEPFIRLVPNTGAP